MSLYLRSFALTSSQESVHFDKGSQADPGENLTIAQIDMCRRRTLGGVHTYLLEELLMRNSTLRLPKNEETPVLGIFNLRNYLFPQRKSLV